MYGVAFQMRIHTEISNRPATFVIDKQGILQYARRGSYFGDRPSVADIITELKKLPN
jgi:peroxiredoxin